MQKFISKVKSLAKQHEAIGGTIFVRDGQVIAGGVTCIPEALAETQTEASSIEVAIGLSLRTGVNLAKSHCYTTTTPTRRDGILLALADIRTIVCTSCTSDFIELCDSAKIDVTETK